MSAERVYRVSAAVEFVVAAVFTLATDWFAAVMCLNCGVLLLLIASDAVTIRDLRQQRSITHTVEVHQLPGESTEVFARRVLDEVRNSVWVKL